MYRRITLALTGVAALALAACSSSSGGNSSGGNGSGTKIGMSSAASQPSAAAPTSASAAPNALSVTAYDEPSMRYTVTGTPQAGLVTITYKNAGDDAHEMTLTKLKPGVTLAQVKAALKKPNPDKAASALLENPDSEITGPQIVGPGLSETATVHLDAGHYIVICFLPGKDGMPHALMGMVADMTVATGTSSAQPPKTDGTVTLTDRKINLPPNIKHGGTFAVTNTGSKPHDFSLAKLKSAPLPAYFQCVAASFGKGTPIDRCPGTLAGGITSIPAGHTAYLTLAPLPAGSYGYVSTEGDGADFKAGLNGTFSV